jgi:hypothetical protein
MAYHSICCFSHFSVVFLDALPVGPARKTRKTPKKRPKPMLTIIQYHKCNYAFIGVMGVFEMIVFENHYSHKLFYRLQVIMHLQLITGLCYAIFD